MANRSQIAAVLATMEGVFAAMAMVVDAGDLEERRQLIACRRRLADRFFDLNRAVDEAMLAGQIGAIHINEYRLQFAAFRRAVSLHQAEWPTILISDNPARYVAASQALRRKREAFISWMRIVFLPNVAAS